MSYDPLDPAHWPMGTDMAWWDSDSQLADGLRPFWATDETTALARLRPKAVLTALGLIHSHRTATTEQLHRLAPMLPAGPSALLWRDMAGLGLVDLGFEPSASGRWAASPTTAPVMGVRLPFRDITERLERLGMTPVEIASLGPTPLRGARQYTRHNLICTEFSCRFRAAGYATLGEAWGRFDLMFDDPSAGRGGPDLEIIRPDGLIVAVEATASATGLADKAARWVRLLDSHPDAGVAVVWLDCARDNQRFHVAGALKQVPGASGRMRLARARDWMDGSLGALSGGGTIDDLPGVGFARADPSRWMRRAAGVIAAGFGLDAAAAEDWPLPDRLEGFFAG